MQIDEFSPNPKYIISDDDLDNKFGNILTAEEIQYVKDSNSGDPKKNPDAKFYLMDQKAFDDEFGNGFNIDNIRAEREYLINYANGIVVANYDGVKITNAKLFKLYFIFKQL